MDSKDLWTESINDFPEVPRDKHINRSKRGISVTEASTRCHVTSGVNNDIERSNKKLLEIKLKLAESAAVVGGNERRDLACFDELFRGDLPCTLLYLDRNSSRLTPLQTFDDLSEYIKTADENPTVRDHVVEMLECAPAGRLLHFATLGKHLRHLQENEKLHDIRIEVDGATFMAHRAAICCHSGFFKALFNKKQNYVKIPVLVKIIGVSAYAFSAFLEYVYTGEINIYPGIVADIFFIADYLDVTRLKEKLASMKCKLTTQEAIQILLKRPCVPSEKLYNIAFDMMLNQFIEASVVAGFLDLDVETFCSLLQSDSLRVVHEFEVFRAAVRWIVHGGRERVPYITRVMNNIRFCNMNEYELFDCLQETSLFLDHTELRELILIANWVLTAMRLDVSDPFNFIVPTHRRSYIGCRQKNYPKREKQGPQLSPETDGKHVILPAQAGPQTPKRTHYPNIRPETKDTLETPKTTSPRYGKPVMIQDEQMRAAFPKWSVQPVTLPCGVPKKFLNYSPKYGKPVIVPPEIQLLQTSYSIPVQEKKKIQRPTLSPASHIKPSIWSPTSSPIYTSDLNLPDDLLTQEPALLSPDVQENCSNHSRRYTKSASSQSRDEKSRSASKQEQQPAMSLTSNAKPSIWSPTSDTETPNYSREHAGPVLHPPGEFERTDLTGTQNFVQPPAGCEKHILWSPYKSTGLSQTSTNQSCKLITHRSTMSPAGQVKPMIYSTALDKELTPSRTQGHLNKESSPICSPRHSDHVLHPFEEPEGHNFPSKPETKSVFRPTMSPASHLKPTIWSPDSNQRSNTQLEKNYTSLVSSRIEYSPSSIERDEYIPASTRKLKTSETHLSYKTSNVFEISRKEADDKSQAQETRIRYESCVISEALAKRLAKPITMPSKERSFQDMSQQLPANDIIIVGCFREGMKSHNDRGRKQWADYCNLPEPRYEFAVAAVQNKLYVIGGSSPDQTKLGQGATNNVLKMDFFDRKWVHVAPMKEARMSHSACVLDDIIYVFGGQDADERPLASCECYNTSTTTWSAITSLPLPIYAGSAAVLAGKCYLAGGLTRTADEDIPSLRMTMIRFDPKWKTWSVPGYLRMPLCHASLVNVQGRLLLCGGETYRDDRAKKKGLVSVANIDEYNLLTNSWRFRAKMTTPRQGTSAVAVGSKLYVIGGKNTADDNVIQLVECYDSNTSTWNECQRELPSSARWIQCVSFQNMK